MNRACAIGHGKGQNLSNVSISAIALATRFGWRVFPVRSNKAPVCPHGFHDATEDPAEIRQLFSRYSVPAIGVATGPSLLCVIDLDVKHGADGRQWWGRQQQVKTATAQTPSGGRHVYFRAPELREIPSSVATLAPNVDVRADNACIIVPPSQTAAGNYKWISPPENGIADMPAWLIRLIARREETPAMQPRPVVYSDWRMNSYLRAALEHASDEVATAKQGQRNVTLNRVAYSMGRLVETGLSEELAAGVLLHAAMTAGLPQRAATQTIKSGLTKGQQNPRRLAV